MSAISSKAEFVLDASAKYSQPNTTSYGAVRARAGLRDRLASAVQWLAEQPRRRAVINELGALTDHELADIGLARGDLARVFDRDFATARRV